MLSYTYAHRSSELLSKLSIALLFAVIGSAAGGSLLAAATPTGTRFVPVTPCRVVDTRKPAGPFGGPFLSANTTREFVIPSSSCGIPTTADAYALNVTVVPHGGLGFLTIWPSGDPRPLASTLNAIDGRVKANAAIVAAGTADKGVSVFATGDTELVLDIMGYFLPDTAASALAFYPLDPCRIADTRKPAGLFGIPSLVHGAERTFPILSSACNVPPSARAYSLNFTVVPKGPLGFLTTWPTGQPRPLASTLNAPTGAVTANAAIVLAGDGGAIDVYASNDTDLVMDINGYFGPAGANGLSLFPITPCRVVDTRQPSGSPILSGTRDLGVTSSGCGIPSAAKAYVNNATVVPPGPLGYLTLWPHGAVMPVVSTLNAIDAAITSNMAIVPTTDGSISAFTSSASHLVLDILGYFAPPNTPVVPRAVSITALSGSGQSTAGGSNYSNPLRAKVLAANSQPLQGLDVTFAAPASAPSVTFAGGGNVAHALTDATGVATSPMMTADATAGSFQVTATAGGGVIATPANFNLTTHGVTPLSITVSNGAVGKYLQSTITVTLSAPAGPAGVPVTLTSSNPSKLLLDGTGNGIVTAPVPSGETQLTIAATNDAEIMLFDLN